MNCEYDSLSQSAAAGQLDLYTREVNRDPKFASTQNHPVAIAKTPSWRTRLSTLDVPTLVIHGTADPIVPFEQSRSMCKAIRNAGGECDLLAVKGGGHGMRGWESAGLTSYKRLMIDWLQKRLA